MTYTVYYKKIGGIFWKKLTRVKGDHSYYTKIGNVILTHAVRIFEQDDETRHEFPMGVYRFKFGRDRFEFIRNNINKESGKA